MTFWPRYWFATSTSLTIPALLAVYVISRALLLDLEFTYEEPAWIKPGVNLLNGDGFMGKLGKYCAAFEEDFAGYLGVSNAIMANSGSSANLLAFFALANPLLPVVPDRRRISPGDKVIVPAVTWSTTVWPIIQVGGIPVFVDSDPATLQMDVQAVEAAIDRKTVAICAVHILGNAVEIERLRELAERHGLWLIEDACESLGTRRNGKPVGTFGDLGTFSFFFSHHITTIEGGMVVTDDDDVADLLRCHPYL